MTTDGRAAPAVRVPKTRARPVCWSPPARISAVEAEQPSTRTASGPANVFGRAKVTKFSVGVAGRERAEPDPRLVVEPAGDAHRHRADAAGVAPEVDDEARRVEVPLDRLADHRHQPRGVEEGVPVDVGDAVLDGPRPEDDVERRQVAEPRLDADRLDQGDRPLDRLALAVAEGDGQLLADRPAEPVLDRPGGVEVQQGRVPVRLGDLLQGRPDLLAGDLDDHPARLDADLRGRRAGVDRHHQGLAVDAADVEAGHAVAGRSARRRRSPRRPCRG